jgi:peptide/nickel transport system ATP-binding protein
MLENNDGNILLNIENLKVVYKTDLETVEAVNDISLTIGRGRTLGLVGETGAGKTTAALSILRLLPATTGRILNGKIEFDGRDILKLDENMMRVIRGNRIAMVFQDPMTSLNPVMTVGDQIAEAIELHNGKMPKDEVDRRVENILQLVGIMPQRRIDYPHQFSGGMKQRVVIAIALSCEPELLIADEPTTALDVTIQAQVLNMIKELRDRLGTAMLIITHDLGIVAQICDDVAVMYAGEIIEAGTVEDIFTDDRRHPYTAGLFNSLPDLRSQAKRLKPIPGLMPDPSNLPKGCVFSSRCGNSMEICARERPKAISTGSHRVSCHLFGSAPAGEYREVK